MQSKVKVDPRSPLDIINDTLKILGSEYVAVPGSLVDKSIAELIKAIPGYINREVQKSLKENQQKEKSMEEQSILNSSMKST